MLTPAVATMRWSLTFTQKPAIQSSRPSTLFVPRCANLDLKPEAEDLNREKAVLLESIGELERLSNSGCAESLQKVARE